MFLFALSNIIFFGGIISMNYNSKTLLDKKFKKNVKGYDALEVDMALDQVILDYKAYEKQVEKDKATIDELSRELEDLKKKFNKNETELKLMKKRVDSIPDLPNVNRQNIKYLQRIAALENALYKAGVDPKKI